MDICLKNKENNTMSVIELDRKFKILLVDDDPMIQVLVKSILEKELMCHTKVAVNGVEAVVLMKENSFDLIISDISMPKMDGTELLKTIRNMAEYRLTPFVFLSGNTQEEIWVKGLDLGGDEFIQKPINKDVFIARIKANLSRLERNRDQLKKTSGHMLSKSLGRLLYCVESSSDILFAEQDLTLQTHIVTNGKELFQILTEENIWFVLVDQKALWVKHLFEKIAEYTRTNNIELSVIMNVETEESDIKHYLSKGVDSFVYKRNSSEMLVNELNRKVKREVNYKNKYVSALGFAAQNSPVRLEPFFNKKIGTSQLSIFTHPFDDLPGGDYYEVVELENGDCFFMVGDVMGKKWDAWFFVLAYIAYIRSTFRFLVENEDWDYSPAKLLTLLNKNVCKDLQLSEVFSTLTAIYWKKESSELKVASAGGLHPLIYTEGKEEVDVIECQGMLLGVMDSWEYEDTLLQLQSNQIFILYTDGYPELQIGNMVLGDDKLEHDIPNIIESGAKNALAFDDIFCKNMNVSKFSDDRTIAMIVPEKFEVSTKYNKLK